MTPATLSEVLAALDPEQHAVATAERGPVCVLAGAGSGKTRALTHRIAALSLSAQVDPRQVLALTFTARAAGELRGRLRQLGVDGVQARTFHAAALRQLRYFWPTVVGGTPPDIAPTKAPLLAEACRRLRISADPTLVRDLAAEIEWAKVSEIGADAYAAKGPAAGRAPVGDLDAAGVGRVYVGYEAVKRDRGVIDFEDVLLLSAGMIDDDPAMAAAVRDQYRTLLVDEYQDVSPIQQRLLDLWLADRDDVTVVGDPQQTIYSFAGATSRFLTEFPQRYQNVRLIQLNRSYRSTPQVVHAANTVLAAGGRPAVVLASQREAGPPPQWVEAVDEAREVVDVVSRIRQLAEQDVPLRDIAVLYRINAQSAAFEEALTEAGVAYSVRGGERFFERREVREAMTLLRGAARGEVPGEAGLAEQVAAVLGAVGYQPTPPPGPSQARDRWESWAALVDVARDLSADAPETTLTVFTDELAARANAAHAPTADAVTLSSLHAAKGLEWAAVFLVGLTDGMLPISYAVTPEQIAEERRLLYVGITRAKDHLTFSYAKHRNPGDSRVRQPSRFLTALKPGFGRASQATTATRPSSRRAAGCRRCGRALTTAVERKLRHCTACGVDVDLALFEKLREWRKQVADEASVPAFVVFTDATLTAIVVEHPGSTAELLKVPGIGQAKAERYGPGVLDVLRSHASNG